MFGVVLWSDSAERKAVIWCEDHGDLAFYHHTRCGPADELDPGDWVKFDLKMEAGQRYATRPQLVAEKLYPELASSLALAAPGDRQITGGRAVSSRKIVPLSRSRTDRQPDRRLAALIAS